MKKPVVRALCLSVSVLVGGTIAISVLAASDPLAASREDIYRALAGHWTGSLEYRDYQTDKRVKLPTLLSATLTPDKSSIELHYTYDDGPGKTVKETDVVHISTAEKLYVVGESDGSRTSYGIVELKGFTQDRGGKLLLLGPGTENNQKVEARTTLEVGPQSLSILRETRLPGGEFKFRHQYFFARSDEKNLSPSKP